MRRNVTMARELGLLRIPDRALIAAEDIGDHDPAKVMVICTGSQGEPMSALAQLATGDNRFLALTEDDTVILSSHPIPGNEHAVTRVIDNLFRLGADVVHSGISDVHATGHAKREELKLYQSIVQPEWFVPVHGEYHHLVAHARIAELMGMPADHVLVAEDGDRLVLDDQGLRKAGTVPADYVYVHGTVGDVSTNVLADRQVLSREGLVSVIVCVDRKGALVAGPEVATRGWVHAGDSAELLRELSGRVDSAVRDALQSGKPNDQELSKVIRRAAGSFVSERTRRRPVIVPVVLRA
jgi:ribonuclease J